MHQKIFLNSVSHLEIPSGILLHTNEELDSIIFFICPVYILDFDWAKGTGALKKRIKTKTRNYSLFVFVFFIFYFLYIVTSRYNLNIRK